MGWSVGFGSFWIELAPLAVLLLIVYVLAVLSRRTLANGTAVLTPRRLVEGYIFTVVLVAMFLVSAGLANIIRPAIAHFAGIESSYRPEPVYDESRKSGEQPRYEYDSKAPRRDLLSGSAELGVGLVIGSLHLWGLRRLGRSEPFATSPVYRLFLIIGLVLYTTAVLVYAVGSVKDWLLYRYVGLPPMRSWYERPVPGDQVAGLVGFLPLWGVLVSRLFRYAHPPTKAT